MKLGGKKIDGKYFKLLSTDVLFNMRILRKYGY